MKYITTSIICAVGTLLATQSATQTARGAAAAGGAASGAVSVQGTTAGTAARGAGSAAGANTGTAVQNGTTVAPFSTVNPNVQVQTGQSANSTADPNQRPPFAPAGTFTNQNQLAATNQFNTNQFAATNSAGASNQFATSSTNRFQRSTNTTSNGSDRGFTEFDQTLITHIRRVIFNPNAQLTINPNEVSFVAQGGVVTVNGAVASPTDAQLLVSQVQTVPGVVSVTSRLAIDPSVAARIAARNSQHNQTLLRPTSDPSLGDSRRFERSPTPTGNSASAGVGFSNQVPTVLLSNEVNTTTTTITNQ
jgi:hypothetical protein